MATDDGPATTVSGSFDAERAIGTIAALYDAIQAIPVPKAGDRADAEAAERLAWLLIQGYNQLLARAVDADATQGTRIRFEVIQALEIHQVAMADIGLRRNGEGGLSLWLNDFVSALADRPISGVKILRNVAGTCAGLSAYICRALSSVGEGGNASSGADVLRPPSPPAPRSTTKVWVPESRPVPRTLTMAPAQYGVREDDSPPVRGEERPQFYA